MKRFRRCSRGGCRQYHAIARRVCPQWRHARM